MSLVVEAIDHHPVVAGEVLEDFCRRVAQDPERRSRQDRMHRPIEMTRQIDGRSGAFEFDDQAAVRRAMQEAVEFRRRLSDPAADGARDPVKRIAEVGPDACGQITRQIVEGTTDDAVAEVKECRRIVARLHDHAVGFANDKQGLRAAGWTPRIEFARARSWKDRPARKRESATAERSPWKPCDQSLGSRPAEERCSRP